MARANIRLVPKKTSDSITFCLQYLILVVKKLKYCCPYHIILQGLGTQISLLVKYKVQVYTEVSRLVMLLLFYIHFPATIFSLKSIKFKRKSLTVPDNYGSEMLTMQIYYHKSFLCVILVLGQKGV